jgi:hypothetical protein
MLSSMLVLSVFAGVILLAPVTAHPGHDDHPMDAVEFHRRQVHL